MAKHKNTYNEGANDERDAIIANLRTDFRKHKGTRVGEYINSKITWLLNRDERYNAKPGGIGKKSRHSPLATRH